MHTRDFAYMTVNSRVQRGIEQVQRQVGDQVRLQDIYKMDHSLSEITLM